MRFFSMVVVLTFILSGCTISNQYLSKVVSPSPDTNETSQKPAELSQDSLVNSEWQVSSEEVSQLGINQTLIFGDDGSLAGSTGCNNIVAGSYSINGQDIELKFGTTRKGCRSEEVAQSEYRFTQNLKVANRYQVLGDKLTLYKDNTELITLEKAN